MILWTVLFLWIGALCWFFYLRLGMTAGRQRRRIAFKPRHSQLTPDQLFGCLLSGNLAVLEQDDFNQLESTLPARQAQQRLALYWGIESHEAWSKAVERRLQALGALSARERGWVDAWVPGVFTDTQGWNPLQDVCTFLTAEACVVRPEDIQARHLNTMAWDVQQAAYIVRLGATAGYASTGMAQNIMQFLQGETRLHYASWNDYFLSSLIGMGMRHHVDIFSPGDWHRIAQTHPVLVSSGDSLLQHASGWSPSDGAASSASATARGLTQPAMTVVTA